MNVVELFKTNTWVKVEVVNKEEYLIQTAFSHFEGYPITLNVKRIDNQWVLSDGGHLLAQISKKVADEISEATLHELSFNAIKLGFDVKDFTVTRTVETIEELDIASRWLVQWLMQSNGVLLKVVNIYEDAMRSFGVNWTGSDEAFKIELKD